MAAFGRLRLNDFVTDLDHRRRTRSRPAQSNLATNSWFWARSEIILTHRVAVAIYLESGEAAKADRAGGGMGLSNTAQYKVHFHNDASLIPTRPADSASSTPGRGFIALTIASNL